MLCESRMDFSRTAINLLRHSVSNLVMNYFKWIIPQSLNQAMSSLKTLQLFNENAQRTMFLWNFKKKKNLNWILNDAFFSMIASDTRTRDSYVIISFRIMDNGLSMSVFQTENEINKIIDANENSTRPNQLFIWIERIRTSSKNSWYIFLNSIEFKLLGWGPSAKPEQTSGH